jgi:hypothetical protein
MSRINLEDFLDQYKPAKKLAEQGYGTGTGPGDPSVGSSAGDPMSPLGPNSPAQSPGGDPNIANMPPDQMGGPPGEEDFSSDPQYPDMPEEKKHLDFEMWKKQFMEASIKGDVQEMKSMILDVRDRNLDDYQRKFVEDNLNIIFLREQSNIEKTSKEIKKLIKDDLDHNNPGTSVANHIVEVLQTQPILNNVYIKLTGLYSMKTDQHRKFIASLTGSVQVGGGGGTEDLIYNEKDFSIRLSTRFNSRFGDIYIGNWNLRTDDPQRYLKAPELQRLEEGSPEEKDALRKRIVTDSICETFKTRAFIINVTGHDGTVYTVGWDIATSLKAGYTDGKLVVRMKQDEGSEAMIDQDGDIVSLADIKIMYMKDSGELDEDGKPYRKEHEFMANRHGQLFLTATMQIIKEASSSFPGLVVRETPYTGNPSDLRVLQRCVPNSPEILMRQCG